MGTALRDWLRRHPPWVGAVFLFCLFMVCVYAPYDILVKPLLHPVAEAEEVWFGILLRGWAAKATEPLHALVYGALAWGLWRDRPWVWPAASLYAAQVAVGMLVWSLLYEPRALAVGVLAFALFGLLAVALWRRRGRAPAAT